MKIKTKSNKKRIAIVAVVVLFVIACGVSAFVLTELNKNQANSGGSSSKLNTPPTKNQIDSGTQIKKDSVENSKANTNSQTLSASFTAATQSGSLLQLRILTSGISNNGKCTLTITKNSVTRTYTAGTQALAAGSTCEGFDIQTSDLGSTGDWVATVIVSMNSQIAQVSQTIKVK